MIDVGRHSQQGSDPPRTPVQQKERQIPVIVPSLRQILHCAFVTLGLLLSMRAAVPVRLKFPVFLPRSFARFSSSSIPFEARGYGVPPFVLSFSRVLLLLLLSSLRFYWLISIPLFIAPSLWLRWV